MNHGKGSEEEPTDTQKTTMMEEAMRVALTVVLKNHTYEFNQEVKRQLEGGPIGMDLTGTVAKIFMKWWDGKLIEKMKDLGYEIRLYERYTYDINAGLLAVEEGVRYRNGVKVITVESLKEDEGCAADRRTFEFIKEVANTIHPSIQVKIDFPSKNADGKVPILDLKVWTDVEGQQKKKIIHEHYVKDVANKLVIEEKSAMSYKNKRTILTQMCLRVLLNNSDHLPEQRKKERVEFFLRRMQASGYNRKFRYEVLKSAISAYNKLREDNGRLLYRGKEYNTPQRRAETSKQPYVVQERWV